MTTSPVHAASAWIYRGVWRVLVDWFRVPPEPPSLPSFAGEAVASFRPADGFLRYLKFAFWLFFGVLDAALFVLWLVILVASPVIGVLSGVAIATAIVVPTVLGYIALHLRYDTTWYVLSERSLRIRRGIWIIHETTITYENVQNLKIDEGPLQRFFGIANVVVETAGGGAAAAPPGHGGGGIGHHGLIEGVANAREIRDLILAKLRRSRSGGLGDEHHETHTSPPGLSGQHLAILREIRDLARAAAR